MQRGKVSVVIPAYNREKYIRQAVDSALEQTYGNVEVIVVDDGCSDGTRPILESYGDRIVLLEHPGRANRGQSASLNLGLQKASGDYIAILDSDDYLTPTKLEDQVSYLEQHPEVGLVYGNGWWVDADGQKPYPFYEPGHHEDGDPGRVLLDCYFSLPGFSLVRADVYRKVGGYDESLRASQDHDMAIRIAEVTKVAFLDKPAFYYRRHGDSISVNSTELRWRNGFIILNKALKRYPYPGRVVRARRAVLYFRLGQVLAARKQWLKAAGCLLMSALNDPMRALGVVLGRERITKPQ